MVKETVKDLVCGMIKPKSQFKFSSVYNGKTYYFCSEQDKEIFDVHPDNWARSGDK